MNYTPSQLRAIKTIDRNLQIIACAGSGKTQVISRRIVEILKTKKAAGISPANIVTFTFTEKAAGELKDLYDRGFLFGIDRLLPPTARRIFQHSLPRPIRGIAAAISAP